MRTVLGLLSRLEERSHDARCSVNGFPLLFPVAPEPPSQAKERRPPSTVRKGTPPAITSTGVGDGLQNRSRLGSTPAIASHRIRASGTDTCRRQCWASPPVKVYLTSEPAKLRTRVDGTDRKPTRASEQAQIRHGWMRVFRPIAPDGNGGIGMRAMRSDPILP